MSQNSLEINEKDLIERPPDWNPGTAPPKSGGFMGGIKDAINQFKEIQSILNDPAVKEILGSLRKGGPGNELRESTAGAQAAGAQMVMAGTAPQFKLFMQVLMAQYGDITIAELLDRLRADFGTRKLSSFGKGQ